MTRHTQDMPHTVQLVRSVVDLLSGRLGAAITAQGPRSEGAAAIAQLCAFLAEITPPALTTTGDTNAGISAQRAFVLELLAELHALLTTPQPVVPSTGMELYCLFLMEQLDDLIDRWTRTRQQTAAPAASPARLRHADGSTSRQGPQGRDGVGR